MMAELVLSITSCLAFATVLAAMPDAPAQGKWEMAPPMPRAMREVVGVAVQRSIFVFGGLNDAAGEIPYGAAYQYDVDTEHWAAHLLACLRRGHWSAGMMGAVSVTKAAT